MEFEYDPEKSAKNLAKHWTAVWTPRGEKTRIISVRRARDKEVQLYESHDC